MAEPVRLVALESWRATVPLCPAGITLFTMGTKTLVVTCPGPNTTVLVTPT